MAKNNERTYWPHMILGFLTIGITLSYWTVKSASSMPVQESNQYMLKYQMADMNINQIMEKKIAFDKAYKNIVRDMLVFGIDSVYRTKIDFAKNMSEFQKHNPMDDFAIAMEYTLTTNEAFKDE